MPESIKQYVINIQEKIDARVMRERVLIFLSVLAFVFMFWNFIIQSSIDKKTQATRSQLETLTTQRTATQTQIAAATQSLLNDPNQQKKVQISQLQSEISQSESKLQRVSGNLIKADQLPQALQEVLQKTQQLALLEVKTLPAQELQFVETNTGGSQPDSKDEQSHAGVYQHAVELRVSGSYSQVMQFLIALEQLPWRFYWQSLDYSVERYPNAEVSLRVYTLSSEEGLFGV